MPLAKRFEDLDIWQESRVLAGEIYRAFSSAKDFGFRNQIQRASVSVMNNISEGFERSSKADFARFLDIARGSSGETRGMLHLAEDLGYLSQGQAEALRDRYILLSRRIRALTNTLRKP